MQAATPDENGLVGSTAGARDVAFFVHGVLDTSIGWVANGTTGSQAFGAWDQGFDVWLGNSRNNSPRDHKGKLVHAQTSLSILA